MDKKDKGEKREFQRISYTAPAEIRGTKSSWKTETQQVSLKALQLKTPEGWKGKPGYHYTVVFPIKEQAAFQLQMVATVTNQNDKIIVFSIEHIDLDSLSHLARLIELHLGDSDLMRAELNKVTRHPPPKE